MDAAFDGDIVPLQRLHDLAHGLRQGRQGIDAGLDPVQRDGGGAHG
jgi:hypothetical protein